ncbi:MULTISPECIES: GNAT family N-acetyltransferase [Niveibacterium]|uniref:L-ornithine N(alpha)-acyltransferase n=1 Tax=Niveibacterium microcysteis TaxID=2811415 RepID=A0ABX7M8U6_9RHOO|nr:MULTISPECIES: GNAT family N-acyltransferase [Niveibacterium]QSI77583.1 GNAT family N-acetyltransferase [Niveibacterium microcysteis]
MLQIESRPERARTRDLQVRLASCETEIREAQKLRWRVFADEMGARLNSREHGVDRDHFDPFCEHLIVRDEAQGRIVGTYRILTPSAARRIGSYYSETEFDLTRFHLIRDRLVEIGRSCIDPEYRSGAVIALLWAGLARFMQENGYEYLMGCASISMADGGHAAAAIYDQLEAHQAPAEWRGFPRLRLPLEALRNGQRAEMPPLIKGYMRAGAMVCGEPAWDPDFNTADLLLLLPMGQTDARYARHFIGSRGE